MFTPITRNSARRLVFAFAIAGCGTLLAQSDRGSLTEQFPKLGAKERARIAAQEAEGSNKDNAYQDAMHQAEQSFQEGRYEDALALYEKARAMRPYNVYPKVKIEDLHALLAKQAAPQDTAASVGSNVKNASAPEPHALEPPPPTPVHEAPAMFQRSALPEPAAVEDPVPEPPSVKKAEGVIERRYKEGHAFVIERTVRVEGRTVVCKRVFHNWGQVYYFEDGLAVDERVWKARFPE